MGEAFVDVGESSLRVGDAWLQLDGWSGRVQQKVRIVGFTQRKVRIEALETTRLGGRGRTLYKGEQATVPAHALRMEQIEGVEVCQW